MKRLNEFLNFRRKIARRYDLELSNLPLKTPFQLKGSNSSYHLYPIRIDNTKSKVSQNDIYKKLWENKIAANIHYIPVYLHPYYKNLNFNRGYCPNSEQYFKSAISIPIFYGLSNEEQTKVIQTIIDVYLEN